MWSVQSDVTMFCLCLTCSHSGTVIELKVASKLQQNFPLSHWAAADESADAIIQHLTTPLRIAALFIEHDIHELGLRSLPAASTSIAIRMVQSVCGPTGGQVDRTSPISVS